MEPLRLTPDRPEDLEQLLEQDEFARARQLTAARVTLDTPELQARITGLERNYEDSVLAEARTMAEGKDLLGAVELLSDALTRVPGSSRLREYRGELEQERRRLLRVNERLQLVARAQYLLRQQDLYLQQISLESPTLEQRWRNSRTEKEAQTLAAKLLEHGEYALQQNDLEPARQCLDLSRTLDDNPAVREVLDELQTVENRQRETTRQADRSRQARQQRISRHHRDRETSVLLEKTRQALKQDDLQEARAAFERIPDSGGKNSEVGAVQDKLDLAVESRVGLLIERGDVQYRADNVIEAIAIWTQARSLDPGNPELKQRLERANKVLTRLEELKRRQK
jgi:tetratricopeptide (TPR) repeat protein